MPSTSCVCLSSHGCDLKCAGGSCSPQQDSVRGLDHQVSTHNPMLSGTARPSHECFSGGRVLLRGTSLHIKPSIVQRPALKPSRGAAAIRQGRPGHGHIRTLLRHAPGLHSSPPYICLQSLQSDAMLEPARPQNYWPRPWAGQSLGAPASGACRRSFASTSPRGGRQSLSWLLVRVFLILTSSCVREG